MTDPKRKIIPLALLGCILWAGVCPAAETPLITPGIRGILERSHLFKEQSKGALWAGYALIVDDEDIIRLSREEAAGLLMAAFHEAPGREDYESAWVTLRSVSGKETVYGKIHQTGTGPPKLNLSMFETNRTILRLAFYIKHGIVKEMDSMVTGLIQVLREKADKHFPNRPENPSKEIEL